MLPGQDDVPATFSFGDDMNSTFQTLLVCTIAALTLPIARADAADSSAQDSAVPASSESQAQAPANADSSPAEAPEQDSAANAPSAGTDEENDIERTFREGAPRTADEELDPDEASRRAIMGEEIDQAIDQATAKAFNDSFDGKSDEPAAGDKEVDQAVSRAIDMEITAAIDAAIERAQDRPLEGAPYHSPATYGNEVRSLRNLRAIPGISGSIGLLRTDSAILGPNGVTRLTLLGDFAGQSNFPTQGTDLTHAGARLGASLVFLRYFEGFMAYRISSDFAESEEGSTLKQTLGNFTFGFKGSTQVFRGFYLGGSLKFDLAPGFGADWDSGVSLNVAPSIIASWDARTINQGVPIVLHLNLGAVFTNQDKIYDSYTPTSFDEYALRINRYNRLAIAFGLELPLPWVTPFLEWDMALPLNTGDLHSPEGKPVEASSAMEHHLAIGAKVTALPDVSFLAAFEFGLSGQTALGIAPSPAFTFYVGLSYAFDPLMNHRDDGGVAANIGEADHKASERQQPEIPAAAPSEPESGDAVSPEDAAAAPAGQEGGEEAQPSVSVPAAAEGNDSEEQSDEQARIVLQAEGRPVAGKLILDDSREGVLDVPADGLPTENLTPGEHRAVFFSDSYLAKAETLTISEGGKRITLTLDKPRPAQPSVTIQGSQVAMETPPSFIGQSSHLREASMDTLDQLADLLLTGKVEKIRVESHTDNRGQPATLMALTKARAEAVKAALVKRGVQENRITAEGKGSSKPIASNSLTKGRARNRRIEVHIAE